MSTERAPWDPPAKLESLETTTSKTAEDTTTNVLTRPAKVRKGSAEATISEYKADKPRRDAEHAAAIVASFRDDLVPTLQNIAKIRQIVGPTSAGWGGKLADLPASKAKEVSALLEQIKNNEFLSQIAHMKEQSEGGTTGIGRVLQSEVPIFKQRWGVLDQTLDTGPLVENLNTLENQLRRMYARMNGDAGGLDSNDAKVRYTAQQKYGILDPTELLHRQDAPKLFAQAPDLKALKPGGETKGVAIPQAMQQEYEDYVGQNLGRLDPAAYATFRGDLAKKYGFGDTPASQETYKAEAARLNEAAKQSRGINLAIPPATAQATIEDKAKAEALGPDSTKGAIRTGILGAADEWSGSALPWALSKMGLGDENQMRTTQQAYEEAHPAANAVGRFAGGVGQLLTPGMRALALRNPAAFYGATGASHGYFNNPDDPLAGTLWGAGWGAATGKGGEAVSALASAAKPELRKLAMRYNVPQTLAGLTDHPVARWLETQLAKVPGTGINKRYEEGIVGLNSAAFNDALSESGQRIATVGHRGVQDAEGVVGGMYDGALRGVRVKNSADLGDAVRSAAESMAEYEPRHAKALMDELSPFIDKPVLDGSDIQEILRRTKDVGSVARKADGGAWFKYVNPHLQNVERNVEDLIGASPFADALPGLQAANRAYRKLGIVKDAVADSTDNGGVFTPDVLHHNTVANIEAFEGKNAVARGQRPNGGELPLFDLATTAANKARGLLVPQAHSTASALALPALATGVGAAHAAYSSLAGEGDPNAPSAGEVFGRDLAIAAPMMLGVRGLYSKAGQKTLQRLLTQTATGRPLEDMVREYAPRVAAAGAQGFLPPAYRYNAPNEPVDVSEIIAQLPMPSKSGKVPDLYSKRMLPASLEDMLAGAPPQEAADAEGD